jgi:hypothetical protein
LPSTAGTAGTTASIAFIRRGRATHQGPQARVVR